MENQTNTQPAEDEDLSECMELLADMLSRAPPAACRERYVARAAEARMDRHQASEEIEKERICINWYLRGWARRRIVANASAARGPEFGEAMGLEFDAGFSPEGKSLDDDTAEIMRECYAAFDADLSLALCERTHAKMIAESKMERRRERARHRA